MDILGDTIQKIAKEKSGIIKDNIPIVTFDQNKFVIDIIKKTAARKNAVLTIIKNSDIELLSFDNQGTSFKYKNYTIKLPLRGEHQILNCVLAINLAEIIINDIDQDKVNKAIINISWSGRIEKLTKNDIFFDVAHNYDGIKAMINTVKRNHPQKKLFGLFCIKGNKNMNSICDLIRESFHQIIIFQDKNKYLLSVNRLSKILDKQRINHLSVSSVKEGVNIIKNINVKESVGLIFGSHYVAREVYNEFGKDFDKTYN